MVVMVMVMMAMMMTMMEDDDGDDGDDDFKLAEDQTVREIRLQLRNNSSSSFSH